MEMKGENGILKLLGITATVCLVTWINNSCTVTNSSADLPRREQSEAPIEHILGSVLISSYQQNELAADQSYKGRQLLVRGKVGKIGKDILDTPYVTIDEEEYGFGAVQAFFSESDVPQLAQLRKGQMIEVTGTCDGLMMNVLLRRSKVSSVAE